jgi:hypothetical protein
MIWQHKRNISVCYCIVQGRQDKHSYWQVLPQHTLQVDMNIVRLCLHLKSLAALNASSKQQCHYLLTNLKKFFLWELLNGFSIAQNTKIKKAYFLRKGSN